METSGLKDLRAYSLVEEVSQGNTQLLPTSPSATPRQGRMSGNTWEELVIPSEGTGKVSQKI